MRADLPVPPPFMWACGTCVGLLDEVATASALTLMHDLYDRAARCQLMLATHLATAHPGEIPDPHGSDCKQCAYYARRPEQRDLWFEHLARGLFLPADVARLL